MSRKPIYLISIWGGILRSPHWKNLKDWADLYWNRLSFKYSEPRSFRALKAVMTMSTLNWSQKQIDYQCSCLFRHKFTLYVNLILYIIDLGMLAPLEILCSHKGWKNKWVRETEMRWVSEWAELRRESCCRTVSKVGSMWSSGWESGRQGEGGGQAWEREGRGGKWKRELSERLCG